MNGPKRLPVLLQSPPKDTSSYEIIPTGCQYCVVGCGYEAHLWQAPEGEPPVGHGSDNPPSLGQAHWVSPAMTGLVRWNGVARMAAVTPDPKCPMNKGNHSPRGGTQGRNLVDSDPASSSEHDSTRERLTTAMIRTRTGWLPLSNDVAWDVLTELVKTATGWKKSRGKKPRVRFRSPGGLGVKLYEYQYLENTFAATKLFYQLIGTPNVAYHDRPSVASNTQGFNDSGIDPHGYAYDDIWDSDVLFLAGNNPYENQSVFFMQYMAGKKIIVLDPRRTMTADYAERTGGLHLQPKFLGADTYVLNALARYIMLQQEAAPMRWPARAATDLIATTPELDKVRQSAGSAPLDEGPDARRRARNRLSLEDYRTFLADQFGGESNPDRILALAEGVSGIPTERLRQAAQILAGPSEGVAADLPVPLSGDKTQASRKVSLIFEKGLIWGFCYQNTAAMANLGLLLGSVLRPGDGGPKQNELGVTGRAGGHQKGWAEPRYTIARELLVPDPLGGPPRPEWRCTTSGYPFYNATDYFGVKADPNDSQSFRTHHYFDAHLVGGRIAERHPHSHGKTANPKQERPDIQLLWIIGSNSVGQIGNAQEKAKAIQDRRKSNQSLPSSAEKDEIVRVLSKRMKAGGLVVVQQDIYPNPTTEFADLVLPAAGWGEENFTRYTGERRLRLYGKFQDAPLYRDPHGGELDQRCVPDWGIFKEIARRLLPDDAGGNGLPEVYCGVELSAADFSWETSEQIFRDMAHNSQLSGSLGALEKSPGPEPLGHDRLRKRGSRGYIIPVTKKPDADEFDERHRTKVDPPLPDKHPYAFVRADWREIQKDFAQNQPRKGEFALCNGRVNELWNSLFTHIRNDTVRQRWPDDMPGPILELHPDHARELGVGNGSIVEVQCEDISYGGAKGAFHAVVSVQNLFTSGGEAPRTAFVIFSYPATTRENGRRPDFPFRNFTTEGYINNVSTGYVDPLNPIAAVKYARGKIKPTGKTYPPNPSSHGYLGPSYQPRNVSFALREGDPGVVKENGQLKRVSLRATRQQRLDWQMRELIVQKGLVRLRILEHVAAGLTKDFRNPDEMFKQIKAMGSTFLVLLPGMSWTTADGILRDNWEEPYVGFVKRWLGQTGDTPTDPTEAMLRLIAEKQPLAQGTHDFVPVDGSTLQSLFQAGTPEAYGNILNFLRNGSYQNKKLVVGQHPEQSEFFRLITTGAMTGIFTATQVEVVRAWIMGLPASGPKTGTTPEEAMLALLQAKQGIAASIHDGVPAGAGSLSDLFQAGDFTGVLRFLLGGKAILAPFAGRRLVTPQNLAESAFYLHITDPRGAMLGRFSAEEVAVVERWIMSLAPDAPGSPPVGDRGAFRLSARRVATGLTKPVFATSPPGDDKRLFVVEQGGAIKILNLATEQLNPQPFLQVPNLSVGGERGLLGLAFHPNYAQNGFFFVNCTDAAGHTNIRRYHVTANADAADPASEQPVLKIEQPFRNHNGGWLAFGPRDGFLYIATGDGGSANDPGNRAQNLNLLLGKLLRIDINGDDFPNDPQRNYAIPPDNPFVGQPSIRPEIWSFGLRNPWRCSFDRQTGDLYIGDVGQDAWEEINFQPSSSTGGENYGWRLREGTRPTGLDPLGNQRLTDPIHEYGRADGFSVIGGYVYRGAGAPAPLGHYHFADLGGNVWTLRHAAGAVDLVKRTAEVNAGNAPIQPIVSFAEDASGELYLISHQGDILRLESTAPEEDRETDMNNSQFRIHPAIGIARLGNSDEFFVGPVIPGVVAAPPPDPADGKVHYKDADGRIKRQAAQFRIFAHTSAGEPVEITRSSPGVSAIEWTVRLANRKAAADKVDEAGKRNPGLSESDLVIAPTAGKLAAPNLQHVFGDGTFRGRTVVLGEAHTDNDGRLLVLGGRGQSGFVLKPGETGGYGGASGTDLHFANNPFWFDDTADGTITATIRFDDGTSAVASSAWVIVGSPDYAPHMPGIVTLWDFLYDLALRSFNFDTSIYDRHANPPWKSGFKPSFPRDIRPILERVLLLRWVTAAAGAPTGPRHNTLGDFAALGAVPPTTGPDPNRTARENVFKRLRVPGGPSLPTQNMPRAHGDAWDNVSPPIPDPFPNGLNLTQTQYEFMRRWMEGQFTNDADTAITSITPVGMDRAALEQCVGGSFYPGIETNRVVSQAGHFVTDANGNATEIRLRPESEVDGRVPGFLTADNALPWQADFLACRRDQPDGRTVWWPAQRPDDVRRRLTNGIQIKVWAEGINHDKDMVEKWSKLGLVVPEPTQQGTPPSFIEDERGLP